jgi:glutathione S-transferase
MAVHAILNELNVPFKANKVSIPNGDNKKPEFLKLNPRGQVPVLTEDDLVIREGAAMIIYLLEKHNSPLLPRSGKERAVALEWLMFGNATLHPAYSRAFFLLKNPLPDKAAHEQMFKLVVQNINNLWKEVDDKLATSKYICGDTMTAADILLTVFANWGTTFPTPVVLGSNVKRLIREISSMPSYQKALKAEEVEYKAAA